MNASIVRVIVVAAALGTLAGCGLAETGAAAAANGASAAEQAKQAKEVQEKVEKQIEDAQRAAAEKVAAAEEGNE